MATVDKRILIRMGKELTDLEQTPPLGVACYPVNDNIVHLQAEIAGPEDSPYHGGSFRIDIHIPDRYPFEPPRCQFLTRVYHPNIDEQGLICLDILKGPPKGTWLPSINITTMLISLQLLLAQPNPDDPLLVDVATEFKENRELFKYKAKEFTKKYATGMQDTKEITSGPDEKTRMVGLKELESLSEESGSSSATSLSRSSSSTSLRAPAPVIATALCLNARSSVQATAPTERISLARPTHRKLTLSRRPTPSVAASVASVLSTPFVTPRRKMSADQGAVAESPKDSLVTREVTPDKVKQDEPAPATHLVKEESVPESVQLSQSKSLHQKSSYPSLQDTIPATIHTTRTSSQIASPGATPTTAASLETEIIKMDRKRVAESIKSEESTTNSKVTTKKIKSEKKLMLGRKPLKRLSSPVKETSKYFSGPPSPLPTPIETTKSAPKEPGVIEDVSPPQEVLMQEPVLHPLPSSDIPGTAEDLLPVSPYSKNKGKSKAVDDVKMVVDPQETDQNESKNRTAHRRQGHAFSFMDDMSPTVTITGSTEALTVAKKRSLLKKNRK
ncbi:Ubiquitin-conjugating enzyme E2 T [Mortierella hygrophila]|uniref:E2 ubiquitin-conjugating enzyme n=1 Tax=Mortierella hygrophila TaxID=979708 RepID=A0A9P6FFV6_9FUNG|nr:Ubiquitin-conjugating enzyme E2 T [Mortierella hygrophila]